MQQAGIGSRTKDRGTLARHAADEDVRNPVAAAAALDLLTTRGPYRAPPSRKYR
jgi:hypothetical protein